jgi:hypothetical protein
MRNRALICTVRAAWIGLAILLTGCMSSATKTQGGATPVRPIDRVRNGIGAVKTQLDAALAAARAVTADPAMNSRSNRQTFSRELRATEQQVQTLRSDAIELHQRASEYLALWGGGTSVLTTDGRINPTSNQASTSLQAKFDEMVSALQQARDVAAPLLANLQQLEGRLRDDVSAAEMQALRPDVQRASAQEALAVAHLNTAVTKLDELKSLAAAANSGTLPRQ